MAKALFLQLPNTGTHVEDGTVCRPGDTIESERDLVACFPGKFVAKDQEQKFSEPVNAKKADPKKAPKSKDHTKGNPKVGDDVTLQFEGAAELGVTVVKAARGKFNVSYLDDENETQELEELTLKAVKNLLEEFGEEEDADE